MSHKKDTLSIYDALKLTESIIENHLIDGKKIPLDFKHNYWKLQLLLLQQNEEKQQTRNDSKLNYYKTLTKEELINHLITTDQILHLQRQDIEITKKQISFLEDFFEKVIAQQKSIRDRKHLNKSNKRKPHDLNWKFAQECFSSIKKLNPTMPRNDCWKLFKEQMLTRSCSPTTISNYFKKLHK